MKSIPSSVRKCASTKPLRRNDAQHVEIAKRAGLFAVNQLHPHCHVEHGSLLKVNDVKRQVPRSDEMVQKIDEPPVPLLIEVSALMLVRKNSQHLCKGEHGYVEPPHSPSSTIEQRLQSGCPRSRFLQEERQEAVRIEQKVLGQVGHSLTMGRELDVRKGAGSMALVDRVDEASQSAAEAESGPPRQKPQAV